MKTHKCVSKMTPPPSLCILLVLLFQPQHLSDSEEVNLPLDLDQYLVQCMVAVNVCVYSHARARYGPNKAEHPVSPASGFANIPRLPALINPAHSVWMLMIPSSAGCCRGAPTSPSATSLLFLPHTGSPACLDS